MITKPAFTKASADGMPSIQDSQSKGGAAQPQSPRPEICKSPPPHHLENVPHGLWGHRLPAHRQESPGRAASSGSKRRWKATTVPPLRAGPGLELLVSVLWGEGSSKSTPPPPRRIPGDARALTLARSSQTSRTECTAQKRTIRSGCTPVGVMQLSESQDRGRLRSNKNVLEPEPWGPRGRIWAGNQRLPLRHSLKTRW